METIGIAISGSRGGLNLQTYFDASIPVQCGNMYDNDWKDDNNPDLQTTRSVHENHVQSNVITGVSVWYDFSLNTRLTIAPLATAEFAYQHFKAEDGEAWHGEASYSSTGTDVSWDNSAAKYYRKGLVADISYQRQTLYTFFGIKIGVQGSPRLKFELSLLASPFTYTFARDIHYGWNTETRTQYKKNYTVQMQNSNFSHFKGTLSASYRLNKIIEFGAAASCLFGEKVTAEYYVEDPETDKLYLRSDLQGGFSVFDVSFKLSAKVHIF